MKKGIIGIVIAAIFAVAILWGVGLYNGLVKLEESVNSSWSQVENVYQRRADLIPNLVASVKGYASHESSTLQAVVEARGKATQMSVDNLDAEGIAQYQSVQSELSSALGRLLVVVENYPELKANENFLDLQAQLEGTENRIAESRREFNAAAQAYNVKLKVFPNVIVASMFHFQPKGYFTADAGAATAPKVEF